MTDHIKVEIYVGAEVYEFYNGDDFIVQDEEGFGLPPSDILSDIAPLQHGATVRDFRLRPRTIMLGIWFKSTTEADHYSKRSEMIEALKLSENANKLRYTLQDGTKRQIDFFYSRGLTFGTSERRGYHQKSAIALFCPDPLFYNPVGKSVTFAQVGGGSSFEIPHPVPHIVGSAASLSDTKQISYGGTYKTHPFLIRITGPITNPVITNATINKKLDFTGTTIGAGDYYDIDLRFGYKTVYDSNGVKKIADLTNDSDLADWHIGAHPKVPNGDNSITATGTNASEATKVVISYYEKFVGM